MRYFPVYGFVPFPFDHGTVDHLSFLNAFHDGGPVLQMDKVEFVTVSPYCNTRFYGQIIGELLHRHVVKTTQQYFQRLGSRDVVRMKLPDSFAYEAYSVGKALFALYHQFHTIIAQSK